ncbi:hypothetical protein, partial [Burkholderia stabilis]
SVREDAPLRTTLRHAARQTHQFRTRRTTPVHSTSPPATPPYRARFTGMPHRAVPGHQHHAVVHQVGSIFAFLARFLRKEATAWMV